MVGSGTEVDKTVLVAVLSEDRSLTIRQRAPPLQLSAPETAEETVDLTIVVLEDAGVDGERAADGLILRYERAFGLVGHGHAEVEHAVVTLGREDEVVLAVLLDDVVVPHLLLGPLHLINVEDDAVIGSLVVLDVIPRKHVVVAHLEVTAVVVETLAGVPVVAGVDVQASVKHIGRGVGHIVIGE